MKLTYDIPELTEGEKALPVCKTEKEAANGREDLRLRGQLEF